MLLKSLWRALYDNLVALKESRESILSSIFLLCHFPHNVLGRPWPDSPPFAASLYLVPLIPFDRVFFSDLRAFQLNFLLDFAASIDVDQRISGRWQHPGDFDRGEFKLLASLNIRDLKDIV